MIRTIRRTLFTPVTTEEVNLNIYWMVAPRIALATSLLLWLHALSQVTMDDLRSMTDIGLLSVLPITYYLALAILLISCCLTIFSQSHREKLIALHLILLILIIHATPPILYGTLRYGWTWKHLGIIDYIQRYGGVDPYIQRLNAYHNWPGFFTFGLLLSQLSGMETPYLYAIWSTPFFDLSYLGAVIIIARSLTADRRLVWLSVLIFYLINWVGQDYFAPQSMAYFWHLVLIGLCLRWFSKHYVPEKSFLKCWIRVNWATNLAHRILEWAQKADPTPIEAPRLQRAGILVIIIILFAGITSTHQLTPFMTVTSVLALVVAQRSIAHGLPVIFGVIILIWFFFVAVAFLNPTAESIIESFGQLSNAKLIVLAEASVGQRIVAIMGRALTGGAVALSGLGALRLIYLKEWKLSAMVLAYGPFVLIAVNSYGGEMIFRVYLFGLPFVAFLVASFFYPTPAHGRSRIFALMTIGLTIGMLTAFFFGYYGKESQYYFSPLEVEASRFLFDHAPAGSLIIEGARNYPTQFKNYEFYTLVPVDREPLESSMRVVNNPLNTLERWMRNDKYTAAYTIITRSQKAEVDMIGGLPKGSLAKIEESLLASPKFEVIFQNDDATIFMLAEGIREGR